MRFETSNFDPGEKQKSETLDRAKIQDIERIEKQLNGVIPIFAHGLARRLAQKGMLGKVKIGAMAGSDWGVAKSPGNHTDIPNVIVYPRESLSGDLRFVNAKLRHEIGNLNYPIGSELNSLRGWCKENKIAPELLTSLVQAVHEASVNYLEIRNSHSSNPEESFKALYQKEINTGRIAQDIGGSTPYKQAVDLTLLYSLSQTGIIPRDQYELALNNVNPEVKEIFNKQIQSVINQSVKTASPKQKVALIKDFVWPKLSRLAIPSDFAGGEAESLSEDDKPAGEINSEGLLENIKGRSAEIEGGDDSRQPNKNEQMAELQEQLRNLTREIKQKMEEAQNRKADGSLRKEINKKKQQELREQLQQQISAEEKEERKDIADQLMKNLREQLQGTQKELAELQQRKEDTQQTASSSSQEPSSMQEIGQQASDLEDTINQEVSKKEEDGVTSEQLQQLKEQLEQLEEVAKQLSESGELEEKLFEENEADEGEIDYNIKEIGIDEAQLSLEQKECLEKVRKFTQGTSRIYKKTLDLLFANYQKRNPRFTEKLISNLKKKKYDLPDFSIYGNGEAENFFKEHEELGINQYGNDFLLNFNLPRPLGKLWYKGGWGRKAQPVKPGEIEWGLFYRMCMPAIWNSVDAAMARGLYLNRINQFGQHTPKEYYYLWQPMSVPDDQDEKRQEPEESLSDQNEDQGSQEQDSQPQGGEGEGFGGGEQGQDGSSGRSGKQEMGSGRKESEAGQSGESDGQSVGEDNAESQSGSQSMGRGDSLGGGRERSAGGSAEGGVPTKEQIKELLSQMQNVVKQAADQGNQSASGINQEVLRQFEEQLKQLQQEIENDGDNIENIGQNLENVLQQLTDTLDQSQKNNEGSLGSESVADGEGASKSDGVGNSKMNEDEVNENGKAEGDASGQGGGKRHDSSNRRDVEDLFSAPDEELLRQLRQSEELIGSKFSQQDVHGNIIEKTSDQVIDEQAGKSNSLQNNTQLETLEEIKRRQEKKMESLYREMSHLDGEALRVYTEYMESTKDFQEDLVNFFVEKFKLDQEYIYERNQRRGVRLQKGFTRNIIGIKEDRAIIHPRSFERKNPPEKPQIVWSLIIDNSGSCGGEVIEQEKRVAVALIEVAKRLDIPLEIVTFGGNRDYIFLKTFEQEILGDDLQKVVLLEADQGTPDAVTLAAACESMKRFIDQFKRSYNFVYFMTDGEGGEKQSIIDKNKRDMVITGIGLSQAASTIRSTWGKSALEVPDVRKLSSSFTRKIEDQIDQTFD